VIEDGKHAKYIGERICQEIEEQPIMTSDKNINITVSIGMCINYPETFPTTLNEAIKKADLCLYKAKNNGKNCVITTDDDQCTPAA
jgi:diguanylate cyclase (GGDEF)-like protein